MKVVRIQRKGRGIFRPKNTDVMDNELAQQVYKRHNNEGFPTPYSEDLDLDSKNWFCAYKSVEQMQQWITQEELEYFISNGFKVYMLEVTEYQEGNMQVIYTKGSIVTKTNITNIFIQ